MTQEPKTKILTTELSEEKSDLLEWEMRKIANETYPNQKVEQILNRADDDQRYWFLLGYRTAQHVDALNIDTLLRTMTNNIVNKIDTRRTPILKPRE